MFILGRFLNRITAFSSSKKGAITIIICWLVATAVLSSIAPKSKEYEVNVSDSGLPTNSPSVIAEQKYKEFFPDAEGIPALLVFSKNATWSEADKAVIGKLANDLTDQKAYPSIKEVIPFDLLPPFVQDSFFSEDGTTLLYPVMLKAHLEMKEINETVMKIEEHSQDLLPKKMTVHVTGPAGIVSDTLTIFSNADLVLLFSTIGLILVLLIIIYRSPLLAIIPLLVAGLVMEVTDRTLGLFGKAGTFALESQSLSIMMILLFATITDYSLFVFSRYREELRKHDSKYTSMKNAMTSVGEPIFFSAGTILAAMLILFFTIYEPYRNFAPVFSVAMLIILIAAVTLIPAMFTLFGRRAFWPAIPKVGDPESKQNSFWSKVANLVVKKPIISGGIVLIFLLVCASNLLNVQFSFNLIKSFPDDLSSRQGYEVLEEKFAPGELAPTTVILTSTEEGVFSTDHTKKFAEALKNEAGIDTVQVNVDHRQFQPSGEGQQEDPFAKEKAITLNLTFKENPYDHAAMDSLVKLRANSEQLLTTNGFDTDKVTMFFNGETAKNADIRDVNKRDTIVAVILITVFITLLLGFQTRSLVAPIYMIITILISYTSALGIGSFIFEKFFNYTEMSYRIPLYSFVFLVALGVDYNIMLMSRIREEIHHHTLENAVKRSITLTGAVISSAGIILAATFGVLTTQPILELFMFGTTVAIGILIDTFLVRGILVPAIVLKIGKWNFWPSKLSKQLEAKSSSNE